MEDSDDPDLPWTGGTSTAFTNDDLNEAAKAEIVKQKQTKNELLPVAETILKKIQVEKDKIADIRSYLKLNLKSQEDILAEYRAREIYLVMLGDFEQWMIQILSKRTAQPKKT